MSETVEAARAAGDVASRWLSRAAIVLVALAAVMGWGASFVGLHAYGMQSMSGFTYWSAWLLPATFDGAAFACTLLTYRSSINGRSALRGRLLMWAFTAVSSWINWIHQPSHQAQVVAAGLPIAAVAVFDIVLIELRADFEARHGRRGFRLRPGLLVLRWCVDRASTKEAFRRQVIDIPVEEIAGLGPLPKRADKANDPEAEVEGPTVVDPEAEAEGPTVVDAPVARPAPQPRPAVGRPPGGRMAAPGNARHALDGVFAPAAPRDLEADRSSGADTLRIRIRSGEPDAGVPEAPEPGAEQDTAVHDGSAAESTTETPIADGQDAGLDGNEREQTVGGEPDGTGATGMIAQPVAGQLEGPTRDAENRAAARRDYRRALESGQQISGAMLGTRYGYSERWGRHQIAAARDEMRRNAHPRLVAVDRR